MTLRPLCRTTMSIRVVPLESNFVDPIHATLDSARNHRNYGTLAMHSFISPSFDVK